MRKFKLYGLLAGIGILFMFGSESVLANDNPTVVLEEEQNQDEPEMNEQSDEAEEIEVQLDEEQLDIYVQDDLGADEVNQSNIEQTEEITQSDSLEQAGVYETEGSQPVVRNGWQKIGDIWYYYMDGSVKTGWLYEGSNWYYLDDDGVMLTGLQIINGKKYYLRPSGAMACGWEFIGNAWYHFRTSGAADIGWLWDGKNWYYTDEDGVMQTGLQVIGNKKYYLKPSGAMAYGWEYIEGNWYFFNDSGAAERHWLELKSIWYYLDDEGVMQTGWILLGDSRYYFDCDGVMQTGWHEIDGKGYFFSASGKWCETVEEQLEEIKKYTYVPYVYGGASTDGWDCSGFVQWAMSQMGVEVPHSSAEQAAVGCEVNLDNRDEWKPGDILLFVRNGRVGHAALYLGNGELMHALNPTKGTYITTVDAYCEMDKQNVLTYVRRVL